MRTRARGACGGAVLAALIVAGGAAAQQNVALNQPYVCSADVMDGWTGLVDGIADSDSGPGCFATADDPVFPKWVTIDLQRPCNISRIAVHNSANGNTRGIIIYCSQDGVHFEKLREFIFPQGEPITLTHRFNDRPAQFVRVEFTNTWGGGLGGDGVIFVREVEVFGSATDGTAVLLPLPQPVGDPFVYTRELRLFERWALDGERPLSLAVFGDSFGACDEGSWPLMVAERLRFARPNEVEVRVTDVTHPGMTPDAGTGDITQVIDADPDLVLVTFGTDVVHWDAEAFRSGLAGVLGRLLAETDGLVVLVGPRPGVGEGIDIARRALLEMERAANLLGIPMLRTEALLLAEGLSGEDLTGDRGEPSERARTLVATSIVQLLVQR
ncbi:MAG: discoidin domain-containing protein [Armatimonadota bacterium]